MMTLDILRALAGIANSDNIDKEVKKKAEEVMLKIINTLEKMTDIEAAAIKKESAAMNGIIS